MSTHHKRSAQYANITHVHNMCKKNIYIKGATSFF